MGVGSAEVVESFEFKSFSLGSGSAAEDSPSFSLVSVGLVSSSVWSWESSDVVEVVVTVIVEVVVVVSCGGSVDVVGDEETTLLALAPVATVVVGAVGANDDDDVTGL